MSLRIALYLALAVAVVNGFARFAYALILPAMRDSLGWDYAASGWLNTANSVGYALGGLSGMLLLAKVRPTQLFAAGLVATVFCIALVGFTSNLYLMLFWRLLAGIGSAWVFACGGALVAAYYQSSQDHRSDQANSGAPIAVFFAGGGLGIALSGLVVFTVLTGAMTWSHAWITLGLVGAILAIMPTLTVLRTEPPSPPLRASDTPLARGWQWRFMGQYRWIICAYFCFGVGYIVYMTFVIAWLKQMRLSDGFVASLWITMGCAAMASGWVWRKAMNSWRPTRTFFAATLCTAIGSAIPIMVKEPVALMLSTVLVGGSFFMVPGAMTELAKKVLPQLGWAPAMNLFTMIFAVGQAVGPVMAGAIADSYSLDVAMTFGFVILICSAGLALIQSKASLT